VECAVYSRCAAQDSADNSHVRYIRAEPLARTSENNSEMTAYIVCMKDWGGKWRETREGKMRRCERPLRDQHSIEELHNAEV